jgi:hypothetical protein
MFWRLTRGRRALLVLGLTSLATSAARAQGSADLPPAKDLIAKYVKATGAEEWRKHKSGRMKATADVPGAGTAQLEVIAVFPSAVAQKMTLPGLGEVSSGYDGTIAWSINPMQGPMILSGAAADQIREEADPENGMRMSPNIVSSETTEKTTMNGIECYKVKHTFKSGRVATDCYGVADGLLVATITKAVTPMGEIEATQYSSEYKDVGGVKRPMKVTTDQMGQRLIVNVVSWEWDNVDPKEVEPPAAIKALKKP